MSKKELDVGAQFDVLRDIELGFHEGLPEKTVNIGVAYMFGPHGFKEIADSYGEVHSNAIWHHKRFTRALSKRRREWKRQVELSNKENFFKNSILNLDNKFN